MLRWQGRWMSSLLEEEIWGIAARKHKAAQGVHQETATLSSCVEYARGAVITILCRHVTVIHFDHDAVHENETAQVASYQLAVLPCSEGRQSLRGR
ncbi:hypothetical protein VTJ04DRAFT_8664 [Mycothermus thermophilus]|uniref:uncharacterized protein n=1 Tax=Humicola insolens TaxID=85995 RepID=UPI003743FE85